MINLINLLWSLLVRALRRLGASDSAANRASTEYAKPGHYTFTAGGKTTDPIPYNASIDDFRAACEKAGLNVTVEGGSNGHGA